LHRAAHIARGPLRHAEALARPLCLSIGAAKLAQQGISVNTGTPAQAQAFVDRQLDTWGKVVRDNGITPD
jgi:hypothetical protein